MMVQFDFPKTFGDMLEAWGNGEFVPVSNLFPAMDATEYESEYVVVAELPGVKKEDVNITLEKNVLTVQGERKPLNVPRDAKVHLNEVRGREFSRSIRIPVQVDAANISAKLENGVLRIVLPKAQEARPRTIEIK